MERFATTTLESVLDALEGIPELTNKVFPVMTEEELRQLAKVIPFPGCGVMYSGLLSRRTEEKVQGGAAGHLLIRIVLFYKVDAILGPEIGRVYRMKAINLLDDIRKVMFALVGPNHRRWEFLLEENPIEEDVLTYWSQGWALPVALT